MAENRAEDEDTVKLEVAAKLKEMIFPAKKSSEKSGEGGGGEGDDETTTKEKSKGLPHEQVPQPDDVYNPQLEKL